MGIIKSPIMAKLICGLIYNELLDSNYSLEEVLKKLTSSFGKIEEKSEKIPFNFTNYYCEEMGENLTRFWVSFEGLIQQDNLVEIKLKTNKLEMDFSIFGKRCVNLDPGYILITKLVLASVKDAPHRIYLGSGIYSEVTLIYKNKKFTPLEWTYPDYRTSTALDFFEKIRKKYLTEIKIYGRG